MYQSVSEEKEKVNRRAIGFLLSEGHVLFRITGWTNKCSIIKKDKQLYWIADQHWQVLTHISFLVEFVLHRYVGSCFLYHNLKV